MALKLEVISGPKGSNPGGACKINNENRILNGYFKYCHGKKIAGNSSFIASHQPIYEAITFNIVRGLGLTTTDFYVIDNRKKDVYFEKWKNFLQHDPSGREFYFFSSFFSSSGKQLSEQEISAIMDFEKNYLELALVADIVGKKQNYTSYSDSKRKDVIYIDLGCSFVHAVDGYLHLPHTIRFNNKKDFKRTIEELRKKNILTCDQNKLNLADFVERIEDINIPFLNPIRTQNIRELINDDEIREIQFLLAGNIKKKLPNLSESELLKT